MFYYILQRIYKYTRKIVRRQDVAVKTGKPDSENYTWNSV